MTDRDPRPGDTAAGDPGAPDVVDVEGRTRQRTVTLVVIAVVLLAIVGAALVLGSDDEPADVPVPPTAAEPPGVTGDPDPHPNGGELLHEVEVDRTPEGH